MTDKLDTAVIRAQMEALDGHTSGPVAGSSDRHPHNLWAKFDNWRNPNHGAAYKTQMATILALCDAQDSLCNALDEARAENERLQAEIAKLGREVNLARYGQPDFAWPVHVEAMERLRAENERLLKAANQARLAFSGYVSTQSAIDMLDAALAQKEGEG